MQDAFKHLLFTYLNKNATDTDIYEQVFKGAQVEIMGESSYLNARDAGIQLVLTKKHKVSAIHLFNGAAEGFCQFEGTFPADLSFAATRAQVRAAYGAPAMSGEAGGVGIMSLDFSFDRFETETYYIRYTFETGDRAARLITLGLA